MATVKKNKKKKIIIAVIIAIVVVALAVVASIMIAKSRIPQVSLYTVGTSNIYETVSATGEITSGAEKNYKIGTVATVKDIYVSVGDEVKQGDLLATFDTSDLDGEVAKLQSSYKQAKASYNDALSAQKTAKKNLAQVQKQIAILEKENASIKKNMNSSVAVVNGSVSYFPLLSVKLELEPVIVTQNDDSLGVDENMANQDLMDAIGELTDAINGATDDAETNGQITDVVIDNITDQIVNGNTSSDDIADIVADAVQDAIQNGEIDSALIPSGEELSKIIQEAVSSVDWSKVLSEIENSDSVTLTSNQLMLTAYYAQEKLYEAEASDSLVTPKKEIMDASKSALEVLQDAQEELSQGWTAAFDGTITECSLYPGETTSLLSGGITLTNLNNLVVTISLGEYDIHSVSIGMPVTVTTAYGTYTGSVISKSPIATGGSSSSILDSVGSIAGISGLSSLTSSGAGVEVKVSVDDPDEFIIIGFNADVTIEVGDHEGITTIPSQAMLMEKTGSYVFVYNEEEQTVTKTLVETGASSVSEYEVISGVELGDKIVVAPQSTFEDNFKVRIK